MSGSESVHRDACRRFHRTMAHYFAVYAWRHGADCVALERDSVERIFRIERVRSSRREWLRHDMLPWFPHLRMSDYVGTNGKLAALYLSRKALPPLPGTRTVRQAADHYTANGVPSVYFERGHGTSAEAFEREVTSSMNLIASGLAPISEFLAPP